MNYFTLTSYSYRGQTFLYLFSSSEGRKLVVDFYEGNKVASSLVSDEEEDDIDNIVPL